MKAAVVDHACNPANEPCCKIENVEFEFAGTIVVSVIYDNYSFANYRWKFQSRRTVKC